MYLATVAPEQAIGQILCHNLTGSDGKKVLSKGHRLAVGDLPRLESLGVREVTVAVLEGDDVHEDAAAETLGAAVAGRGVATTAPVASRVNILATAMGVLRVDVAALLQINLIDGLTVATLPTHTLVHAKQRVATIKVIPFSVRRTDLQTAVAVGQEGAGVITLAPLRKLSVGILLVGSAATRPRMQTGILAALTDRITELGSNVLDVQYAPPREQAIAGAISALRGDGARAIIIAGETSIMDQDDVTPRGIRRAGGVIEQYGAPIEPGNQFLLGYLEGSEPIPILGAPGCARSRKANIVDLVLPRLLTGEHLTKHDIAVLGHGGLL